MFRPASTPPSIVPTMATQALRLLCLAALLLGICASKGDLLPGHSSLVLWSNAGIVGNGHGPKVMYQVLDSAQDATTRAVLRVVNNQEAASELLAAGEGAAAPTTTIVFAGSQLGAEELRRGGAARLNLVLGSAASSLVVPHAIGEACPHKLLSKLSAAGLQVQSAGCDAASDDLVRDVAAALSGAQQPQVLVVCPAQSRVKESALDFELDQLMAVQEAVEASGVRHMFIYTSHKASAASPAQRRSLAASNATSNLTGFGKYTTCGQLCVTETRWLEGMLSVLFLALASCAGMTCLNVLQTPTRYETVKEGAT